MEIELAERRMSLKEHEVVLRIATAEVKAIELANKKTRFTLEKEK